MGGFIVLAVAIGLAVLAYRAARKKGQKRPVLIGAVALVLAYVVGAILLRLVGGQPPQETAAVIQPAPAPTPAPAAEVAKQPAPEAAQAKALEFLKLADRTGEELTTAVKLRDTAWAGQRTKEIEQAMASFDLKENPALEAYRPCFMALVEIRDVIGFFFSGQMTVDTKNLAAAGIERFEAKSNQCEDAANPASTDPQG